MKSKKGYSELYEQALRVAAIEHRRQSRKGGKVPYITHPVQVSTILLHYGFSTEVAIAGLLHDAVEDQGYDLSEIEGKFGIRVAEIVCALSERKTDTHSAKRSWETRKQEALKLVRQAIPEAAAVKAADTLHNVRCITLDVRREGPRFWQRFNRGPRQKLDYYRRVLQVVREKLQDHPLVDELESAVEDMAQVIEEADCTDADSESGIDHLSRPP